MVEYITFLWNKNFVLSIHVAGVVLKSLRINEVGGKTIYLLC